MTYTLEVGMDSDHDFFELEALTFHEAIKEAKEVAETWARDGDFGVEGARIDVLVKILNEDDEVLFNDWITVDIEPDEDALIRKAGGNPDCDHCWEGFGGLKTNPGVFSLGGTKLLSKTRCLLCNLERTDTYTGSQYNPGEHDTVEFYQPED